MRRGTRYELTSVALRTFGVAASAAAAFLIEVWVNAAVKRCRRNLADAQAD